MIRDDAGPALLEGAERADIAGVSIELIRQGQGRPLVFLHGMDGLEGSLDLLRRLSRNFEVVAPSHPGFGASELPASFDTVDDIAYLYLDLIETLDLADAIVVGMSFGGWIAAEMLIKSTRGISHAVLGAPLGLRGPDRRRNDITDIFMMPAPAAERLMQVTERPDVNLAAMDTSRLRRTLRNREAVSLFGWSPYLNDPKLRQRLHRIGVPTLVLWGADDALIPPRYGESYASALPDARLHTIDRCGHRIHVDQPEQLAELILQFASTGRTREAKHARLAV
ncbi:MAG TPA: alpha/beta hydrolase [Xanthobacteraceae bacterium]|nr:alpha/beta hydrolase [Xanthobacteraceae bacterium]